MLPPLELNYASSLNNALKAMGMAVAFDAAKADFARIHPPPPPLFIGDVEHKTYVKVDEEGTEAAAATSVGNRRYEHGRAAGAAFDDDRGPSIFLRHRGAPIRRCAVRRNDHDSRPPLTPAIGLRDADFWLRRAVGFAHVEQYWHAGLSREGRRGDSMQLMFSHRARLLPDPENEVLKQRSFFGLSNKHFDPVQGARLLNEYIDDKYCRGTRLRRRGAQRALMARPTAWARSWTLRRRCSRTHQARQNRTDR